MMNEWILSSSLMIAALLLGRRLLRGKISLRLQYALWLIVLTRLLLPVQIFTSDFGVGTVARDVDLSAPVRQVYISAREDSYERAYADAYQQVTSQYQASSQSYDPVTVEREAQAQAQRRMELDLTQILYSVWLGGMAVMAMVIIGCNLNFLLRLRRSRRPLEENSLLPVYVTAAVPTPCIFGFFRPGIYLTPEAAGDARVRSHVLAHELTHYRHGDHIWSVLRSLCVVIHWYNPLVWLAAKVSRGDAELACDEGTLLCIGEDQRADYGRTLIGLSCAEKIATNFVAATTMTGSARSLAARLKLLMRRQRNTVLALICVVLIGAIVVGCAFSGAPETSDPVESTPAETTEPTGHPPEHDMSDHSEQIPIPEDPAHTITPIAPIVSAYAPPMEQILAEYADRNPRELTEKEIEQVNEAFASTVYDEEQDAYSVSAVSAFFTSYYDDVTKLDLREFLRYFPISGAASEEEFQLLHQTYGTYFFWSECPTIHEMPVPVHRYEVSYIDEVLRRYAGIPYEELQFKDSEYYLEETDCYYNFTSDFGPGMFPCTGGFVYDGGAILYTGSAALYLNETMGNYTIQAHLPVRDTREVEITAAVETLILAYEENVNLGADNDYDGLTVLAADSERTVTWQDEKVPLSDFYGNIGYLHGKEAYWKHVRRDQGISPSGFQVSTRIFDIRYDGDAATLRAEVNVSFTYTDAAAPSGLGETYDFVLVQVDGVWLVADVTERYDWFDEEYKNNPDFDPDALIAAHIP